jgi:polyhydroxybutyrate depolymerase
MFSHRIACEAADLFAAVAPVSGQLGIAADTCSPTRPIPVLHIHGTGDIIAPYNGGVSPAAPGQWFVSVAETIATWVGKNACTNSTPEEYLRNGTAHCERYAACAAGVTVSLCMLDGEGHCWPGNANCLSMGQATTDLDASEEIWNFFSQAQLP